MGLCTSSEERAERNKSQKIDRMLENDNEKLRRECKLLLLGSGESGKSTIVKQMKILYQGGYSKEELATWRIPVYRNLMESAQALVSAVYKYEFQFQNELNEHNAMRIMEYQLTQGYMSPDLATAVGSVWKDPAISQVLALDGSKFYLMDSAPYFFDQVERIGKPDYVPTEQDVLHTRCKTTGIIETRFKLGSLNIHMFDVGGQRSERRKWIHCFESVTCIVFCVAISEYDQVLLEESRQNRLMESLVLFESVVNSRWFSQTPVVLLLNKIDVFSQKIPRVPLERYFPDYGGGPDVGKAGKYILWRFYQTNRAKLRIYPHFTQATKTSNLKIVFHLISKKVLQDSLKDSGLL